MKNIFRERKLLNLALCLIFCLNFIFSNSALAGPRYQPDSMLRPKASVSVMDLVIETLADIHKREGASALKAKLADLILDKVTDPAEKEFMRKQIAVLKHDDKLYFVCMLGDGWRIDLSEPEVKIQYFSSRDELIDFIRSSQFTWIAGTGAYTPYEIEQAKTQTDALLKTAAEEKRLIVEGTEDEIRAQVDEYLKENTARGFAELSKDEKNKLIQRLVDFFKFRHGLIDSITQEDVDKFDAKETADEVKRGLKDKNIIRHMGIFSRKGAPSYFSDGEVGSSKWLAVTITASWFGLREYNPQKTGGKHPGNIISLDIAIDESYMEAAKTNPNAFLAAKYKLLREYFLVTQTERRDREESKEVAGLINAAEESALTGWIDRGRSAAKAKKQGPASEKDRYKVEMKKLGYQLIEEVGGNEALVFKAKNAQGRIVAVKIIRSPEVTAYQSASAEEIQNIVRSLKDAPANVEKVMEIGDISIGEGEPLTYLVTEYIEGQSLEKYFATLKNPADFNEIMRLAGGVIDGYNFLKKSGLKVSPVVMDRIILSKQTKEPVITYYLFTDRHAQYEEAAITRTLLEMVIGANSLFMKDKERYVQDTQAIISEITQPRYGEGGLAQGLAEIFKAYLNEEAGYSSAADIYQHLRRLQRAQNQVFYASWKEFEQKEIAGKAMSQQKRNLSEPQRIAFNINSFPDDDEVLLFGGINRIIDNIFRLLDGNPNFVPAAVFLGDYNESTPSSFKQFAEFLNSNPALGNSKYSVKLQGQTLIINGQAIPLYKGWATAEKLAELGVDFLIEAARQRYLTEERTSKAQEEEAQASRIEGYLSRLKGLKAIVLTPEEDKDEVFAVGPIVNRINTTTAFKPEARKAVLAEPVTSVAGIMAKIVDDTVKAQNEKAEISVIKVAPIRTDRQGNRLTNKLKTKAALALSKIVPVKRSEDFAGSVTDTAVISGANAIKVILRIDGFLQDLNQETINTAFREASKGALKGLIDYKGEKTASSFETFGQAPLIFKPVEKNDLDLIRPPDGAPYRTVVLTGFYSETGYAKQALDLMTEISMFEGNKATPQEAASAKNPQGTISRTPEKIRLQTADDGAPILVAPTAVRGRISVNLWRRLWDEPNIRIIAVNGVRAKAEGLTADLLEFDQVFGEAPFTIDITSDRKNFKITDREERVIVLDRPSGGTLENIPTPYGNLFVQQKYGAGITQMKLHGEEVLNFKVTDNQDGTLSAQGKLRNGTTVRVAYLNDASPLINFVSARIKKQEIIPTGNIRADRSIYTQRKGESTEAFLSRIEEENRKVARQIIAEFSQINDNVMVVDSSGQLIEKIKLQPFFLAGAGSGLISAPAKTKIPGATAADATVVPGVNDELFLSAWDILEAGSAASCTTNAAAVGAKALLDMFFVVSGYFDTIHALTNTQGRQFGEILKNITRSVDARGNIVYESTGASTELGRAIAELLNTISGVSLRVGNDDGSLINFDLQVVPRDGKTIPSAEEINAAVKRITETPEIEGGLKGFLGYGEYKTSLEIIGSEFGGIFDPSLTRVNRETGTVSVSIWYDNERGYTNQFVNLILLKGLHQRELEKNIEIVAQNAIDITGTSGAYTGRVSVESVKQNGATGAMAGLGSFREFEEEANRNRTELVNVNAEINKVLKKSLELGMSLPLLNIYISEADQAAERVNDVINPQISGAFKDIPPEDIMRIAVSLEVAGKNTAVIDSYLEAIRKVIAGYVSGIFVDSARIETEEIRRKSGEDGYNAYIAGLRGLVRGTTDMETISNYGNLLGANVASKVRVILKLGSSGVQNEQAVRALTAKPGVDGIILPKMVYKTDHILEVIDSEIANNFEKREELNKRLQPRFFVGISSGSGLLDYDQMRSEYAKVNSHHIQLVALPALAQLGQFSSLQKGEQLPQMNLPPANKVPVRVLLQNATLELDKEGFMNLDSAALWLGVHDVLVTHSEQIELTGISDKEAAQIVKRVHRLRKERKITGTAVVAVGETAADYDAGQSKTVVEEQVLGRLEGSSKEEVAATVIAYEPRWAIGTGRTPEFIEIQEMHKAIRNTIKDKYGVEVSQRVRIIYGGSLNSRNAKDILNLDDVDGALIGGASTSAEEFLKIAKIAEDVVNSKPVSGRHFYKKMYIAGNHKAMPVKNTYTEFVNALVGIDRRKVEVALGPELSNYSQLTSVYNKDPLKDIVFIDQLSRAEIQPTIQPTIFHDRVDMNISLDDINAMPQDPDTWEITGEARIKAAMPTIKHISDNGGITVIVTHFRPTGNNVSGPQSIGFIVSSIEKHLGKKITFVRDLSLSARQAALKNARPGDVILLENLELDPTMAALEKSKNPADLNKLAAMLYIGANPANPTAGVARINDGFGVMHRPHGSVIGKVPGVPMLGGLCLKEELKFGVGVIKNARHPVALVFGGGAKIDKKIPMLKNIILNTLTEGDTLFIYGAAAIPFLMQRVSNFEPGKSISLVDEETRQAAAEIIELAEVEGVNIVLPVDFVVADNLPSDEVQSISTVSIHSVPASKFLHDIGKETVERFEEAVLNPDGTSKFGTIIENGPAGRFESEQFRRGTQGIHNIIVKATKAGAITILGGGDTGYAAELTGVDDEVSFVSTGGGAFLELAEGRDLPGVEVLRGAAGRYAHHLTPNIAASYENISGRLSDYAAQNVQEPVAPDLPYVSNYQLGESAFETAADTDNKKVILINASVLKSDLSLIFALQNINLQINERADNSVDDGIIEEVNAYRPVLVYDGTQEELERLFNIIAEVTGVKPHREMFARVITQDDIGKDNISHSAEILKQLDRVGTPRDSIAALLGAKEWVEKLKQEEGIPKDTLSIIIPKTKEGEITFAGNALFAAVEAVAAENKTLTEQMLSQLEMKQEGTTIEAVPKGIVSEFAATIKFYRDRISKL